MSLPTYRCYVTELRVRSIGTSALCNAVSNSESDLWLQVRYRTYFRLKWFSLWDMDRVHNPLWQLCYWDRMPLLVMWCPRGAMASLGSSGSPACNLVSLVNLQWLLPFYLTFTEPLLFWLDILCVRSSGTQSILQHRRMDATPLVFLSYCWSEAWVWSSSLKPS